MTKKILLRSFFAILILLFLIIWAMFYAVKFYYLPEIQKSAEYQLKTRAKEISFFVARFSNPTQVLAQLLEKTPDIVQDETKLTNWLAKNRYSDKNLDALIFLDLNGQILSDKGKKADFTDKKYGNWIHINSTYYDYLLQAKKSDSLVTDHILSPFSKNKDGKPQVDFATFKVVKNANGQVIGALGSLVKVDYLRTIATSTNIASFTLSFVVDSQATVIAHESNQYIGSWNMLEKDEGLKDLAKITQSFIDNPKFQILKTESVPYEYSPTQSNFQLSIFITPVEGTLGWALGSATPDLLLMFPILTTLAALAIAFLISFVIFFVLLIFMSRYFNRILLAIAQKLAAISSDSGDLSERLEVLAGNDPLAQLVNNFNYFIETISGFVKDIINSSKALGVYSQDISESSQAMNENMEIQKSEIEHISISMQQMVATVIKVAEYAQNASNIAQKGSLATDLGAKSVASVIDSIEIQAKSINATASDIENLQQAGASIGEVMEVINAIAEQTNLLALNAAIEAARAGDAGRGFAVVADEVRSLAARTHESTNEISQTVTNLRTSIEKSAITMRSSIDRSNRSVDEAKTTGEILNKLRDSIKNLEELNLLIASATDEQTATVDELSSNLKNVIHVAGLTSDSALDLETKGISLNSTSQKLQNLIDRFKL